MVVAEVEPRWDVTYRWSLTGFVGIGNRPTPLSPDEVERIMRRIEAEEPRVQVDRSLGLNVDVDDVNLDVMILRDVPAGSGRLKWA